MALASPALADDVVATLQDYISDTAVDQAYEAALVLGLLFKASKQPGLQSPQGQALLSMGLRGSDMPNVVKEMDGRQAVIPVSFNTPTTVQNFYGGDVLTTAIDPVLNMVYSDWAYKTAYVGQTLTEEIENSGPEKKLDILKERTDMTMRGTSDTLETDWWSTNTDVNHSTQKAMPGVRGYVATSPSTGTIWGENRATYATWRNNADTVGSFATNGLDKMDSMRKSCSGTNSADPPSIWMTTSAVHGYYTKIAQSIHRLTKDDLSAVDLGAATACFDGRPVVYTSKCPSGSMYAINLAYLRLLIHKNANWRIVRPANPNDQLIADQLRIVFGATWGSTRWNRHGVLSSITA